MKKILISIILASAIAANVHAMNMNLALSDDLAASIKSFSFGYQLFEVDGMNRHDVGSESNGVKMIHFGEFMSAFNRSVASINPTDNIDGTHSHVSFSYEKFDGTNVSPLSCQFIIAKPVLNILVNETGCIVS